jgi:UDP-hydrolysing UDP-N-acetyl-D-glucosamine 2-epimerase
MNLPLAHTMGGEVSGTIDESIRHAVTEFAHIHFPACTDAAERIVKLGERPEDVHTVGCPRMDLVKEVLDAGTEIDGELFGEGVGGRFPLDEPFLVVSQHPVTTEYEDGKRQVTETLEAVRKLDLPAIVLWPNADAGSEKVSAGIRAFREFHDDSKLHFFKNLPVDVYLRLLARTACLVGNSSSGIREGCFIGAPVVNIGSRQDMRQRGSNVIDVPYERDAIAAAIEAQVAHGPYDHEPIYGDGSAGVRIADVLATTTWQLQKRITY